MSKPATKTKASNKRASQAISASQGASSAPAIPHDLQASIPFLLASAGNRTGQAFSTELKRFGLALNEWRACASLRQLPGQRLMALAEHTSIDASTLSRMVDGLVQRGVLVRERCDDDARAIALRLTAEGETVVDRVIPLAQLYERVMLSGIDGEQVRLLRELLRRIHDNTALLDPKG